MRKRKRKREAKIENKIASLQRIFRIAFSFFPRFASLPRNVASLSHFFSLRFASTLVFSGKCNFSALCPNQIGEMFVRTYVRCPLSFA
jgi:hypothetical protein